uniref:Uncharacterized protein n=1 Tax=Rhizophora mucronata TaxID=61149 RepID=A0A2P2NLU7_RHIMU
MLQSSYARILYSHVQPTICAKHELRKRPITTFFMLSLTATYLTNKPKCILTAIWNHRNP